MYLTDRPIDLAALLGEPRSSDGAVCVFVGVVRNESEGRETVAIEYEAYAPMAESELAHIVASLPFVWPSASVRICHRVGRLEVGEASVAIVVTAPHREDAFAACRQAIENIKEWVPIWKREIRADGSSEWVAPKHLDTIAGR
jgi:molybdopterin synthase catalytic subunit